jgi:hypothetical protein
MGMERRTHISILSVQLEKDFSKPGCLHLARPQPQSFAFYSGLDKLRHRFKDVNFLPLEALRNVEDCCFIPIVSLSRFASMLIEIEYGVFPQKR